MTVDETKLREILQGELIQGAFRQTLEQTLEIEFAKAFGQFSRYFDRRFKEFEDKTDRRINDIYNLVAKFKGRMDNDDSERAAITNQLDRHNRWINELADDTGTQLSPP